MKKSATDPSAEPARPLPLAARLEATLDKIDTALQLPDAVRKVHEARKALKAYRALLRLIPTEEAARQRRSAAAIARHLAGDRDRQAARDAIELVRGRGLLSDEDARIAHAAFSEDAGGSSHLAGHVRRLRAWIRDARKLHARVLAAQASEVDLPASLARAYRKARRAGDFSTPDAMHELRKRVVTHRYQMSFFADLTGRGAGRAQKAQHLRDVLGAIQDIQTLLAKMSDAIVPDAALRDRITHAGTRVQEDLATEAREAHATLFRRQTGDIRARLRRQLRKEAKPKADVGHEPPS